MKNTFLKFALAVLSLSFLAASASAETQVVRYNGHAVTVEITLHDPECGDRGVIIDSPFSTEIGKTVIIL